MDQLLVALDVESAAHAARARRVAPRRGGRIQDRQPSIHFRGTLDRASARGQRRSGVSRSQVSRHPQYGRAGGCRSGVAWRLDGQRARIRWDHNDAGGERRRRETAVRTGMPAPPRFSCAASLAASPHVLPPAACAAVEHPDAERARPRRPPARQLRMSWNFKSRKTRSPSCRRARAMAKPKMNRRLES